MVQPTYNFTPLKGYEDFEATTQIIIAEILKRKLPFEVLDANNNLIAVTHNSREYIILEGTISDANSLIAYWISDNKWMTKQFLKRRGINFAKGILVKKGETLDSLDLPEYPLVVKPADTDHGIAVSTNLTTYEQLQAAVSKAFKHSEKVIIEEHFEGKEYRFLVIGGVVRAVMYREPANVIGDGVQTVRQLIDNKNIGRGDDYRYPLLKIKIDDEVERHLKAHNISVGSVLPAGVKLYLRRNSNLSTGGDSIDVTDTMPQFYKNVAVEAASAAGLRIAGVDIIIQNLEDAPAQTAYIVVELNAPAMLSMHNFPYIGKNRHVEKYVLDAILNS